MAATLDHISGGRMVLGLGAGWQENEHQQYGIPFYTVGERLAHLDEACAVIKSLFTQAQSDFAGTYYTLTKASLEPKPVQDPLPLLIGGGGEKVTLRIAARWADEWNVWVINEVVEVMKKYPGYKLYVTGHRYVKDESHLIEIIDIMYKIYLIIRIIVPNRVYG